MSTPNRKPKKLKKKLPIMKFGLKPKTEDKRDFKVTQLGGFLTPDIFDLPKKYLIGEPELKNQLNTLFCTLFSMSSILEPKEEAVLSPEFWAKEATKAYGENWPNEGLEQRQACKLALKGALEANKVVYPLAQYGAEFVANPVNYKAEQDRYALEHAQSAYFEIKPLGELDLFDSIRYTLWKFRDEKRGAVAGMLWDMEWIRPEIIDTEGRAGGGHQVAIIGWQDDYLIIQNSYGTSAGKNGRHLFSRDIVNKRFNLGLSIFKDCSPEEIERLKKENAPKKVSWFRQWWNILMRKKMLK